MASNKKVAFLIASEGTERVELEDPWGAVEDAGYEPVLLCPDDGEAELFDHLDKKTTQKVDKNVGEADLDDYAGLVLPGGVANPDNLRMHEDAVEFVREFVASGKPVAAICHAPWTLIEAGVVDGKRLASWPSLKTDIRNAGGEWVDERVVSDGNLITSRNPDDLPAFTNALLEALDHGAAGTSS
ncbi:MAG TPA: type 1 glutamine amidotransferase domain-containing protein [Nocardioides sp.]|nr:type 1 glutamine amidotransferase domain-containing protein [Nocardioides sp.]